QVPQNSLLWPLRYHTSASARAPRAFPPRRSSDLVGNFRRNLAFPHHAINAAFGLATAGAEVKPTVRTDRDIRGVQRLTFQKHFRDRKSTRLNSSHVKISYAVFCLKKKS